MSRRGLTLIEMLVALAATLLMMAAVTQAFQAMGGAIGGGRAVLDLDARMRNVAWRLRSDLAGATARMLPPVQADAGEGYFEIIEGPVTEAITAGSTVGPADHDDVLLFTTRNTETPFLGRASGTNTAIDNLFESTLAEVAWFARKTAGSTNPETYTLYRKQLLVMGYMGTDPFPTSNNNTLAFPGAWSAYFNRPCDVSARREGNTLYPNTIADLTRRESRFMHNVAGTTDVSGFPFAFVAHQASSAPDGLIFDTDQRRGEDIVLTNVLAFDVHVFDPAAPVWLSGSTPLVPGDGAVGTAVGSGAYVDLGHGVATNALVSGQSIAPRFAGTGMAASKLTRTYDTWSTHYEANGRDEDGDGAADDANDGLDNNGNGTIDDAGELETSPPYPWPLRGIEVRIRCYEPSSRRVRQVTVRHTFVPH